MSGGGRVKKGAIVTVSASPSSGYYWVGWYSGGVLLSTSQTYTFAATSNMTLEARFRLPVIGEPGTSYQATASTSSGRYATYNWVYGAPKRIVVTSVYEYYSITSEFSGSYPRVASDDLIVPYGSTSHNFYLIDYRNVGTSRTVYLSVTTSGLSYGGVYSSKSAGKEIRFTAYY